MKACSCSSMAINLDPNNERCDVCYLFDCLSQIAFAHRDRKRMQAMAWEHVVTALVKFDRHKWQPLKPMPKEAE